MMIMCLTHKVNVPFVQNANLLLIARFGPDIEIELSHK